MGKISVTIIDGYYITVNEKVKKGLYFQCPVQKVFYSSYYDIDKYSAWMYATLIKSSFLKRLYETLIGNRKIVRNIEKWSKELDFGGFTKNILCSPIYFSRNINYLHATTDDKNRYIQEVFSYGYEENFPKEDNAIVEKTKIHFKKGIKKKRIKSKSMILIYSTIPGFKEFMKDMINVDKD